MTGATSKSAARLFILGAVLLFVQAGFLAFTSLDPTAALVSVVLGVMIMIAAYGASTGATYATYRDTGYGVQEYSGQMEVGAYCGLLGPLALIISFIQFNPVFQDSGLVAAIPFIPGIVGGAIGAIGWLVYVKAMRGHYKSQRTQRRY